MPENTDITVIGGLIAIVTTLLTALGVLWRGNITDRRKSEKKNEAQTNRVIEEIKAGAKAVQKIQEDVLNMVQDNQKVLMNGHEVIKKDIKNIEEVSKENSFKIELIEEKLKNK